MNSENSNYIRLQKFIADCGVTSRRKAEDLISLGKVKVNGKIIKILGTKVNPSEDVVWVDDRVIDLKQVEKIYIMMNKPRGYVTTLNDPEGRKTVMDICQEISERIYPVGRLDYLSEGLLLLTNDGEVANMIMHPSHNIVKVYEVKVFGVVTQEILSKLRKGINGPEGSIKPKSVRIIKNLPNKTWLEFRLAEGKNREIRRICEGNGVTVEKLKRIAIGGLSIDNLTAGKYFILTKKELLKAVGLSPKGIAPTDKVIETFSPKKSVKSKIDKRSKTPVIKADDRKYVKYRKENYYQTIHSHKILELEAKTKD